jgi:hypothetical protein
VHERFRGRGVIAVERLTALDRFPFVSDEDYARVTVFLAKVLRRAPGIR